MVRRVVVVPHNSDWVRQFDLESQVLQESLADNLLGLHPVGSTAISGIHAKPIIDTLAEVADLKRVDDHLKWQRRQSMTL